ncbi:MAG TPA: hypothetical protein VE395_11095, partial [Acidimicrobiales bacterium]|nr:hypothetical protein [Acidimicrobiales bacterium]
MPPRNADHGHGAAVAIDLELVSVGELSRGTVHTHHGGDAELMRTIAEWLCDAPTSTTTVDGETWAGARARVVTDPADPRGIEPGEVLVAPLTDPA